VTELVSISQEYILLRVAFIDYVLEPDKPGRTGLSGVVWDMASELVRQGHEAHVIASYHTREYPDPRVTVHNFPTPPFGYRNVVGHFWMLKRAAAIVRNLQPDIVHAPEYVSTAVLSQLGVQSPLVMTAPGNVFHRIRYGHSYEWYYLQILKWAARISARRCACIIAVSQEMKRWWEWTGSPAERVLCIPYGVDTERFHLVPDARTQLGIHPDKLLLLYAGRFAREKGLFDLLDALRLVKPLLRSDAVQIILAGEGAQLTALQQRVEMDGLHSVVEIRPWIPQHELKLWYSAADALLLPSYSEGFARVIPEALICGSPVIGTRITGTEDHIHDRLNGLLFDVGDTPALAQILQEVIQDSSHLRKMRSASLAYAQSHLTWASIMSSIVDQVYLPAVKLRVQSLHDASVRSGTRGIR
jgi:glycosyltransferase involved in cell wall biosynthesis